VIVIGTCVLAFLTLLAIPVLPLLSRSRQRLALAVNCLAYAGLGAGVGFYVAHDRGGGIDRVSRWSSYDARAFLVIAVVTAVVASGLSLYAAVRRPRLIVSAATTGAVAAVANYLALAALTG
jgi:hypothetical protein